MASQNSLCLGFPEGLKRGLLSFDDSPDHELHTGDIITFDFSHIGLVENDDGPTVFTIKGTPMGPVLATAEGLR